MRYLPSVGAFAVVTTALSLIACTAEDAPEAAASEANLTKLSITLEGRGDGLEVDDRPRLKTRAVGSLGCGARFDFEGRTRVTCTRGDERLEVIAHAGGETALLVHKGDVRTDAETFYACTTKSKGDDGLPGSLDCSRAELRPRPDAEGLASPFDSTVSGITIANAHPVGTSGALLRSMAPTTPAHFDELDAAGVKAVLVFKNPTPVGHDVDEEAKTLVSHGLAAEDVVNIPFRWKEIGPFEEPCRQVVRGLAFLKTRLAAGKKTLFHCTVGEDRTGFLAAMFRLTTEKSLDPGAAWDGDMCERGYGAGNPLKPGFVVETLEGSLRPLYRKMAFLATTGALDALDEDVCKSDPEGDAAFEKNALPLERLACGTSTLFVP